MPRFIPMLRKAAFACALFAAQSAGAGQIVIGQVAPLEGLDAFQGQAYSAGMQLAFDNANKAGEALGHTFSLVSKDDGQRPDSTLSQTLDLLAEAKPLALAGYFGSTGLAEIVKSGVLPREKIALVGYRATEIRADTPYLYNVRADLREEIHKMVEHLATVGIQRLGIFHEAGPGEKALNEAVDMAAQKASATILVRASHPTGTTQVSSAVRAFLDKPPQAILILTSGAAGVGFIEQYRMSGGNAQLLAQSGTDFEQMAQWLGHETLRGVTIAQVTPSPYRISNRLSKEFSEAVAKARNLEAPPSYAMMEGFIVGKVIIEAVRRIGTKPPSREAFVAALDSLRHFDMGGYSVNYEPGARSGSRFVELTIIGNAGKDRGKIRQ